MTETDDKLLKQFFGEQKQEIEDNGFSRRVMRNLPGRNHRLVQAWGAACSSSMRHFVLHFGRSASHHQYTARSICLDGPAKCHNRIRPEIPVYRRPGTCLLRGAQGMVDGITRRDHTKAMQDIQYNCPKNRRKTCFRTRDVLSL